MTHHEAIEVMDSDFEEKIVYNPILGAAALWHFVHKYETTGEKHESPTLLKIIPVLPILMVRDAVLKLRKMQFKSGLNKVLLDDPTIAVNLPQRVADHASLTLKSLNIACASGLLRRNGSAHDDLRFTRAMFELPQSAKPSGTHTDILASAERLGAYFREETELQIEIKLGIRL